MATPGGRSQVDLTTRCNEPELMDDFGIAGAEVHAALREIEAVNRYLGGAATTLSGLGPFLRRRQETLHLLDVGTGGGDIPVAIARRCRRAGVPVRIVAVDLGADACRVARAAAGAFPEIEICRADVFRLPFRPHSFHLAHCAMFLHHFTQAEIADILRALAGLVREGIVINDLRRHAVAYHSIRLLTRLVSRSRLVRHDAPLSVRRGFRAADLDDIQARCGLPGFRYERHWAFRYLCRIDLRGR